MTSNMDPHSSALMMENDAYAQEIRIVVQGWKAACVVTKVDSMIDGQ